MDPYLLQRQLRENAAELQDMYKELRSWGKEIKKKDEALKGKTSSSPIQKESEKRKKKSKPKEDATSEKIDKKKRACTDYSAWEKFDVEEECNKLDSESSDSELTDEHDETKRQEAIIHKEKGNSYVKEQKWENAIACYTKAIYCFRYDPVFFANRALCHLKMKEFKKAEDDCTLSLKLDATYVKAYQRRSVARENLNQLDAAKYDLEKVLEFEPNNKESKIALDRIIKLLESQKSEARPVSQFAASRLSKKTVKPSPIIPNANKAVDTSKNTSNWPNDENIILVNAIKKPPHMQSKKPLKRIKIVEKDSLSKSTEMENTSQNKENSIPTNRNTKEEQLISEVMAYPKPDDQELSVNTDNLKVFSHQNPEEFNEPETCKNMKNSTNDNKRLNTNILTTQPVNLEIPKNSVQFYTAWKQLKSNSLRYQYLKSVNPDALPDIFKESLESDVFSEILNTLVEYFIPNSDPVFKFLYYLSQVRRFSTIAMFMSSTDKNSLWKLIDHIKSQEDTPRDSLEELINKYEL